MSRSGYDEDCDNWALIRWRGAVEAAIRGKRGQALLKEMAEALDAMPDKRLISDELVTKQGEVCALGAVAKRRCLNVDGIEPYDSRRVAQTFGVAEAMVREIAFINDDDFGYSDTPENRWKRVRKWVDENLKNAPASA